MTIPRWERPKNIQIKRSMNLLALDTSTDHLSIAVCREVDGRTQVWTHHGPGGAAASSTLIPAVMALLAQAGLGLRDLGAIAFGAGPGSFTGLRTACAVAQGLGYGAGVPLLPVDSLLAVAEDARQTQAPDAAAFKVVAVLDARMDEVYTARYVWEAARWTQPGDWAVCKPEALAAPDGPGPWVVAGNAFAAYGERLLPGWSRVDARPTAAAMLRLAPALLAAGQAVPAGQALPRYIRDKVAKTTDERALEKAAAGLAAASSTD
jgi:tRNA threonylcarbamoyladenosine biosynthesis protein TsaB